MLIGILGKKGVGKTTMSKHLVENYGFEIDSFAEPLKQALKIVFGFTEEQVNGAFKEVEDEYWKVTPRLIMQLFGTEIFQYEIPKYVEMKTGNRLFGRDHWVRLMDKRRGLDIQHGRNIVIHDVRFAHEVNYIRQKGGIIARVVNPDLPKPTDAHPSEMELDSMVVEEVLNDGKNMLSFKLNIDYFLRANTKTEMEQ